MMMVSCSRISGEGGGGLRPLLAPQEPPYVRPPSNLHIVLNLHSGRFNISEEWASFPFLGFLGAFFFVGEARASPFPFAFSYLHR